MRKRLFVSNVVSHVVSFLTPPYSGVLALVVLVVIVVAIVFRRNLSAKVFGQKSSDAELINR